MRDATGSAGLRPRQALASSAVLPATWSPPGPHG